MSVNEKVNTFFDKLPFKSMAEKIPAEKRAKAPILDKLIPWANQIVCGLAVVLIIIIIAAASGGGPKALAKETYKLSQQALSVGTNPVKAANLLLKTQKIQAEVEKLSDDKEAIYLAELGRLMSGEKASRSSGGSSSKTTKATKPTVAPASDFKYQLTADRKGVRILAYTGNASILIIPATIEDMPVVEMGDPAEELPYPLIIYEGFTEIVLPESVTRIAPYAFTKTSLTKVTLPKGLKEIPDNAFMSCRRLETINLPDSIEKIGVDAFYECNNLKTVNLPTSLKEIGRGAFNGCGELNNLSIPDSLSSIKFPKGYANTDNKAFISSTKLPLKTRSRLEDLGYKDGFGY
jgi:hypothetical protein